MSTVNPRLLTKEEIDQCFDLERYYTNYLSLYYMYYPIGLLQITRVIFFDGDTNIKGNLDAGWVIAQLEKLNEDASLDFILILINGNIMVEGDICIGDHHLPLIVLGNAHCDVLENRHDYIHITGNAYIKYVFRGGYYNHGSVNVDGNAYVPYVLNDNYSSPFAPEPFVPEGAVFISLAYRDNRDTIKYDYTREDLAEVIIPAAFNGEGNVDEKKFIEIVKSGQSPFIDGRKPGTIDNIWS
ncbi:hypothetical protein A4D02_11070 [Niastella koreensis]|uniref:Leucine-rich repeat protein n=2 Tax=Niastella koreensis TaxID=354356 RepID=G8T8C4_NIAKG|nr:hypothetical protein [Niastella koreensis]AEV99094.1 leucine-rich repeat protein [Niastella koreensis GR20-10]OQP44006.1 hypothetical protein A4D02_11070 [Niastella koreensis]